MDLCPAVPGATILNRASWDDLPTDLQRRILSPVLSLPELARLASISKSIREIYRERCVAEEQWLLDVATAVFGKRLVELLTQALVFPARNLPRGAEIQSR